MNNDLNDYHAKNLYKWKKHDAKLNSKIKESDNIQNIHQWLRKVEDVSETAITNVFNPKPKTSKANSHPVPDKKSNFLSKFLPMDDTPVLHKKIDEDPFSEAHDLINKWVTDKIRLDIDDDFYNYVDVGEMNTFQSNQKVLDQIKAEIMNDETDSILDINGIDYDKYDEDYIAKDIVSKMMKKKFVDPIKLLKQDERKAKPVDYQLKIELRHQAVKENREKRQKELEAKRKEKLEKKEIEIKAKQIVQKEEQDKIARMNIEQQLIEQEVQKLRVQMLEQRKHEEELRKRHQEMEMIRLERERQEMVNLKKKFEISNIESEMEAKRNLMAEKRAEDLVNTYLKAKNMRLVQKVFLAWYSSILDNRLKSGKANALADWKLSYKVFNAWKRISTVERVKKDHEIHQNLVKIENIKNVKASNHHNASVLKRYFKDWRKFTRSEQLAKEAEKEKLKTKTKMQQFLEAAAEGKLQPDKIPLTSRSVKSNSSRSTLRRSKSFENDQVIDKKQTKTVVKPKLKVISSPKSKQLNTENEELEPNATKPIDLDKKVKELMWPWVKAPFAVNNFDNRFKAQDKLLHEQHQMIRDQQKLIEEMKFQQGQVAFKEQIKILEEIKAKQIDLERMQKLQYKEEKRLLRQKATMIKNKPDDLNLKIESEIDENESENETETTNKPEIKTPNDQATFRDQSTFNLNSTISQQNTNRKNDSFSVKMEERAKQREQMRKERENKKRKQEMERLELMKLQQEEKLRIEEEEKRKKSEELKEKRKIQKDLEDKRNVVKLKEQSGLIKADQFYKKYLMRYYCINGLRKLIEIREYKMSLAIKHYNSCIFGKIMNQWKININIELNKKYAIANEFNNKRLVKHCFKNGLKQFKQCIQIETAKAARFYKYKMKFKLFEAWKIYKVNEKKKAVSYEILIAQHNLSRIKIKYFQLWKAFPVEQRRLKLKQKRLDELRLKVREMIPDYEGPSTVCTNSTN